MKSGRVKIQLIRIIVAGSRDFNDYDLLKEKLDKLNKHFNGFEIVSGRARGADLLGEKYAKENNLPIAEFAADWDTHGKKAGFLRNADMAEYADGCVVFWDGKSKGTKHMIDLAKQKGIQIAIVNYGEDIKRRN